MRFLTLLPSILVNHAIVVQPGRTRGCHGPFSFFQERKSPPEKERRLSFLRASASISGPGFKSRQSHYPRRGLCPPCPDRTLPPLVAFRFTTFNLISLIGRMLPRVAGNLGFPRRLSPLPPFDFFLCGATASFFPKKESKAFHIPAVALPVTGEPRFPLRRAGRSPLIFYFGIISLQLRLKGNIGITFGCIWAFFPSPWPP